VPGPRRADPGLHWRIRGAEAVATALLVLVILVAVALTLAGGSPAPMRCPGAARGSSRSDCSSPRRSR
jgi:hypothetical protein